MATSEFSQLMRRWQADEPDALSALVEIVDSELRRLARHYLRGERAGHTLQTTALINEVWVQVLERKLRAFQNRAHFIAVAATIMRHLITDRARQRLSQKKGEGAIRVSLGEAESAQDERLTELLALSEALDHLYQHDEQIARVAELFGYWGLQNKEVAEALDVSEATATRKWQAAQVWLKRELTKTRA
ncbi:MAG: sigma-70 family RNA polymerase sigma factor [Acidobacteria bacterium]|nr:sigma-70 family RNA polymerase sigma factor [Acidobacteriota bacterium]